jgi:hypothetical protein
MQIDADMHLDPDPTFHLDADPGLVAPESDLIIVTWSEGQPGQQPGDSSVPTGPAFNIHIASKNDIYPSG